MKNGGGFQLNNRQAYSDPTAAVAIGKVQKELKNEKVITDCFASRKGKCSVLNISKCKGLSCGFYKTEVQVREGKIKAFERIKTLDKPLQMHISETYYGRKMPWMKGDV